MKVELQFARNIMGRSKYWPNMYASPQSGPSIPPASDRIPNQHHIESFNFTALCFDPLLRLRRAAALPPNQKCRFSGLWSVRMGVWFLWRIQILEYYFQELSISREWQHCLLEQEHTWKVSLDVSTFCYFICVFVPCVCNVCVLFWLAGFGGGGGSVAIKMEGRSMSTKIRAVRHLEGSVIKTQNLRFAVVI